ncbi:MAG: GTP cyclohydrolase II [Marinosulfonomonas sp.]|nr:GTP cyclohydrolase II [Marinosulfonomonas sp.]
MKFALTLSERLARARVDLRLGVPILLQSGDSTILAAAAETLSEDRFRDFRLIGQPLITLTKRRAETLKARCYDGDIARISIPPEVTCGWVVSLADPSSDLIAPMKGPLIALREGNADLHRAAISLAKAARLLPAVLTVALDRESAAAMATELTLIDTQATADILATPSVAKHVVSAKVPLQVSDAGRLHVFRPDDGGEEHYAVEIGQPDRSKPVLARLHSACFTGDLLGSLKCDCGAQLNAALAQMGAEKAGILLYLNQEGRGIGLANKMRAYSLQDQGFDTVQANHRLGFEDDERDFRIGATLLKELGFSAVRLLTNNPEKVRMLTANGIDVTERVPLKVGKNAVNAKYLDTKAKKSGHLL